MTKLLIIGIDGMDRELVEKYMDYLPNLKRLTEMSVPVKASSVFPPDSDTAWASIYTGLNPARHGIVDFADPMDRGKINKEQLEYLDASILRGKTFWDIAGKQGKRICLIYPHMAYPVWPMNGFMASPHPKTGEVEIYPSDFEFKSTFEKPIVQKRIPKSRLEFKEYIVKKRKIVLDEFAFGRQMAVEHDWDLLFLYSSALDSIMHLFWNYCDPDDPTYPGPGPFSDVIKDFHILHDKEIGNLMEKVGWDTPVLLFSDHGHGMRPVDLFNVNEVLLRARFLVPKRGGMAPLYSMKEFAKRAAANFAQRWGLRAAAMTMIRTFPGLKKMYTSPSNIDFNRTIAHCTDLSGMKAYTYGGIRVLKDKLGSDSAYEKTRDEIISLLREQRLTDSSEGVFEWICKREDLYEGIHLDKYPDIVFNLKEGYGAGWGINGPLFSKTMSHKFYPGSHRGDSPVFCLTNQMRKPIAKKEVTMMDVAPTILDILGIDWTPYEFDGRSVFGEGS